MFVDKNNNIPENTKNENVDARFYNDHITMKYSDVQSINQTIYNLFKDLEEKVKHEKNQLKNYISKTIQQHFVLI